MRLNPSEAALFALVAICLVALGVIVSGDVKQFSIAERGSVLAGIVAVLVGVYWLGRHKGGSNGNDL